LLRSWVWSGRPGRLTLLALGLLVATCALLIGSRSVGRANSGGDPYSVPLVVDTNPNPHIVETTLTAEYATVDIGNGVLAHAETFNGSIPGPTFELNVGDTVIVHFQNHLNVGTGIHWHGIELPNQMDGTPFTQNPVPPGGSFLYYFKVTRPGIFWYHPHHDPTDDSNTNQVFSGLYGMIVVRDPNEAALQASGTLPPADQTKPLVLSDTTVCKAPGTNDAVTYPNPGGNTLPWVGNPGGGTTPALPVQANPTPKMLCETPTAVDGAGNLRLSSYAAGDIPSIQQTVGGRENEGQTVLTNGQNVGGRAGSPAAPGALAPGASTLNVRPGQGLRLQLVNTSAIRYFRLHLTDSTGANIPLIRVGGEGGLLDNAVEEGGTQGTWVTGYDAGEIVLPPGSRADVVAAIPASATGVMTMWTEDYQRTGLGFSDIPTVPVMHLNVTGAPLSPAYTISAGTPLRAATGDLVPVLGPATGTLLNPATFNPAKLGSAAQNIKFTQGPTPGTIGIDGVTASHDVPNYETAPHLGSTRYAKPGDTLELSVTNTTQAHHPFHMHGFSIQPVSLSNGTTQTFTWPYAEFRDNVDIPPGFTLTFRVKIEPRPQADGITPGGELGRWLFHCHIFFHATLGMLSELVVTAPNGKERPDINVNATQVTVSQGQTATVTGTYFDVDNEPAKLSSSVGSMHDSGGGNFTWSYQTGTTSSRFVYLTATNADGSTGQVPFFLNIVNHGGPKLLLPGSKSAAIGSSLSFRIRATDPNPFLPVKLSASRLPRSLRFKDNHNRTGTASGKITARKGTYLAKFTASDGKNPPVSGTVRIRVTPSELSALIGKRVRLSGGAISVGCNVLNGSIRTCKVFMFSGRKRVAHSSARLRKSGKRSITVKVKFSGKTQRRIAQLRHGLKLSLRLSVTRSGSRKVLTANATTIVLPPKR
jgi:FtsP/CotA-like multicopper oxidase with cupredoxin domain